MSYEDGVCLRFLDCVPYVARLLGVSTAVVLWGIGFDLLYHKHTHGAYIIVASIVLLFAEVTWAITLFLEVCLRNDNSPVLKCWAAVLWFSSWKKSVVYWTVATVLLIKHQKHWLSTLAGGMLIVLGCLHLAQAIRSRFRSKEMLLQHSEETYDRFDEDIESMNGGEISNDPESESAASTTEYIVQV